MKMFVEIQGECFPVEIIPSAEKVKINQEFFTYQQLNPGLILVNNKFVPYDLIYDASGKLTGVVLLGKSIPVRLASSKETEKSKSEPREVHAPLNGQIVRVHAQPGALVKAGQTVLTLEAMKMENEVSAVSEGVLKKLYVKENEVVKAGQLLFIIEPVDGHENL